MNGDKRIIEWMEGTLEQESTQNSSLKEKIKMLEAELLALREQTKMNEQSEQELILNLSTKESNTQDEKQLLRSHIRDLSAKNSMLENINDLIRLEANETQRKLTGQVNHLEQTVKQLNRDYAEVVSAKESLEEMLEQLERKYAKVVSAKESLQQRVQDLEAELSYVQKNAREGDSSPNAKRSDSPLILPETPPTSTSLIDSPGDLSVSKKGDASSEQVNSTPETPLGEVKPASVHGYSMSKDAESGPLRTIPETASQRMDLERKDASKGHICPSNEEGNPLGKGEQRSDAMDLVKNGAEQQLRLELNLSARKGTSSGHLPNGPSPESTREAGSTPEAGDENCVDSHSSVHNEDDHEPLSKNVNSIPKTPLKVFSYQPTVEDGSSPPVILDSLPNTAGVGILERATSIDSAENENGVEIGDKCGLSSLSNSSVPDSKLDELGTRGEEVVTENVGEASPSDGQADSQLLVVADSHGVSQMSIQETLETGHQLSGESEASSVEDPHRQSPFVPNSKCDENRGEESLVVAETPRPRKADPTVSISEDDPQGVSSQMAIPETLETGDQMSCDESKGPSSLSYPGVEDPQQDQSPAEHDENGTRGGEEAVAENVRKAKSIPETLEAGIPPVPESVDSQLLVVADGANHRPSEGVSNQMAIPETLETGLSALSYPGVEDPQHQSPVVPDSKLDENGTRGEETLKEVREASEQLSDPPLSPLLSPQISACSGTIQETPQTSRVVRHDHPLSPPPTTHDKFGHTAPSMNPIDDGSAGEELGLSKGYNEATACRQALVSLERSGVVDFSKEILDHQNGSMSKDDDAFSKNAESVLAPPSDTRKDPELSDPPINVAETPKARDAIPTLQASQTNLEDASEEPPLSPPGVTDEPMVPAPLLDENAGEEPFVVSETSVSAWKTSNGVANTEQPPTQSPSEEEGVESNPPPRRSTRHQEKLLGLKDNPVPQHENTPPKPRGQNTKPLRKAPSPRSADTKADWKEKIKSSYRQRFGVDVSERIQFWSGLGKPPPGPFIINLSSPRIEDAVLDDETWTGIELKADEMFNAIPSSGKIETETKNLGKVYEAVSNNITSTTAVKGGNDKDDRFQYDILNAKAHKWLRKFKVLKDVKNLYQLKFYCTLIVMSQVYGEMFDERKGEFGNDYQPELLKEYECWNALFFGLGPCWNGLKFLKAVRLLRYWKRFRPFQRISIRLAVLLLLLRRLNDQKFVNERRKWLEDVVALSPYGSDLQHTTTLTLLQDCLGEPLVVARALACDGPSENTVQPPTLALPTPAGTLTGSAGGKSVDILVDSTPSSPTTPCPTNGRKRKLDARDARDISGDQSPTKKQRRIPSACKRGSGRKRKLDATRKRQKQFPDITVETSAKSESPKQKQRLVKSATSTEEQTHPRNNGKRNASGEVPGAPPTKRQRQESCDSEDAEDLGFQGSSDEGEETAKKMRGQPDDPADRSVEWDRIRELIRSGDPLAPLLEKLLPGQWLNDDVVDAIADLFPQNPQIEILRTDFFEQGWDPKAYRLSATEPGKRRFVFINRYRHWLFLDVHPNEKAIYIYDSLATEEDPEIKKNRERIPSICRGVARTVDSVFDGAGSKQWTFHSDVQQTASQSEPCPLSRQQFDWINCGPIALENAFCLSTGIDPRSGSFMQEEWRLKWARKMIESRDRVIVAMKQRNNTRRSRGAAPVNNLHHDTALNALPSTNADKTRPAPATPGEPSTGAASSSGGDATKIERKPTKTAPTPERMTPQVDEAKSATPQPSEPRVTPPLADGSNSGCETPLNGDEPSTSATNIDKRPASALSPGATDGVKWQGSDVAASTPATVEKMTAPGDTKVVGATSATRPSPNCDGSTSSPAEIQQNALSEGTPANEPNVTPPFAEKAPSNSGCEIPLTRDEPSNIDKRLDSPGAATEGVKWPGGDVTMPATKEKMTPGDTKVVRATLPNCEGSTPSSPAKIQQNAPSKDIPANEPLTENWCETTLSPDAAQGVQWPVNDLTGSIPLPDKMTEDTEVDEAKSRPSLPAEIQQNGPGEGIPAHELRLPASSSSGRKTHTDKRHASNLSPGTAAEGEWLGSDLTASIPLPSAQKMTAAEDTNGPIPSAREAFSETLPLAGELLSDSVRATVEDPAPDISRESIEGFPTSSVDPLGMSPLMTGWSPLDAIPVWQPGHDIYWGDTTYGDEFWDEWPN